MPRSCAEAAVDGSDLERCTPLAPERLAGWRSNPYQDRQPETQAHRGKKTKLSSWIAFCCLR
jgi:hypothetical protein